MGAGQSIVEAKQDEDSLYLEPGNKCVLTPPLPDDVTFDKFWDALVSSFKSDFKLAPYFKDGGVREFTDEHFITYSVFPSPNGGELRTKVVYRTDKSKGEIYEEGRDPFADVLIWAGVTKVHQDPLRVEYWRQFINPTRLGYEVPRRTLAGVLGKALDREVTVLGDQGSTIVPPLGSRCAVSESLDEVSNIDDLYDAMLEVLTTLSYNDWVTPDSVAVEEDETDVEGDAVTVVNAEFDGAKMQERGVPDAKSILVRYHIKANRTHYAFIVQISRQDHVHLEVFHYNLAQDPLRVESFRVVPASGPVGDDKAKEVVSQVVSRSIQRARGEDAPP